MRRLAAAALLAAAATTGAQAAQPITGRYVVEDGTAVVEVARCGTALCGRIARVLKPRHGGPTTDVNNRDPALRARPILGLPILTSFTDAGDDWRGRIYDPRNGKSYRSIVSREAGGGLKVQGCIAFICQTQRWRAAR